MLSIRKGIFSSACDGTPLCLHLEPGQPAVAQGQPVPGFVGAPVFATSPSQLSVWIYVYRYLYLRLYPYLYTYISMSMSISISMSTFHIYIYVYIYLCIYMCLHVWRNSDCLTFRRCRLLFKPSEIEKERPCLMA